MSAPSFFFLLPVIFIPAHYIKLLFKKEQLFSIMRPSLALLILIIGCFHIPAAFGRLIHLYYGMRAAPTDSPSTSPSASAHPSAQPSSQPTSSPSSSPSTSPSFRPSLRPSFQLTFTSHHHRSQLQLLQLLRAYLLSLALALDLAASSLPRQW